MTWVKCPACLMFIKRPLNREACSACGYDFKTRIRDSSQERIISLSLNLESLREQIMVLERELHDGERELERLQRAHLEVEENER